MKAPPFNGLRQLLQAHPFAGICFGAALLFIVLGILQQLYLPDLHQTLSDLQEENYHIEVNVTNAKTLPKHIEEAQGLHKSIEEYLNKINNAADIFHYFYELEAKTEVSLENPKILGSKPFLIGDEKAGKKLDLTCTTYKINMTGAFSNLLEFIYKVQRENPLFAIETCQLLHETTAKDPATLTLSLQVDLLSLEKPFSS